MTESIFGEKKKHPNFSSFNLSQNLEKEGNIWGLHCILNTNCKQLTICFGNFFPLSLSLSLA